MSIPITVPILDFTDIDTHNPNLLGIVDTSFYPDSFQIVNPTLEITPPSFIKATVVYSPQTLNIFNSNNLNITCVTSPDNLTALPDGLWEIRMTVNPVETYSQTKTYLRTKNIERSYGVALLKTDISQCSGNIKKQQMAMLDEIWYYIQCSIGAANDCNYRVSMELYREAATMLKDFVDCRPNYYMNPGYYLAGE